jgi:hypothetical protein
MKRANWSCIASTVIILLIAAAAAEAQTVTFSRIDDAVGSRWFDPATTRPDSLDRNKLIIGFNRGLDSTTLKYREFRASTLAYSYTSATDTISFRIQAPSGYYITKITYTQRGSGSVARTGKAAGATTWTVAEASASLGTFTTSPSFTRTLDVSSKRLTVVPVSITASLFAFATPSNGSATVSLTGADVRVQVARLP